MSKLQELDSQSYADWQRDRQAYWDDMAERGAKLNIDIRTTSYRSSDEYYANLGSYIAQRQEDALPIAGEGGMEFLRSLSVATRWGSRILPPLRFATIAIDVVIIYGEIEGYGA